MASTDPSRAFSFGQFAEEYALWRPAYPRDAVDWLLPSGALRVADVGAGTGKLTGQLLERRLDVEAVERASAVGGSRGGRRRLDR